MVIYHIAPKRSGHAWTQKMMKSWLDGIPISDLEGWSPRDLVARFGVTDLMDGIIVLQIRDLLNWYASYTRGHHRFRVGAIPTWESAAQEFYFPEVLNRFKVVRLSYDDFADSKKYRMDICNQLGGIYNEKKLNSVPNAGSGSTFDGLDYDLRGSEMQTRTRYKQISPEAYEVLFKNRPGLREFYLKTAKDPEKINYVKSLKL